MTDPKGKTAINLCAILERITRGKEVVSIEILGYEELGEFNGDLILPRLKVVFVEEHK